MFSDDFKQFRFIFKLVISIFAACSLIYLSFRYIHIWVAGFRWLLHVLMPFLLGILFALILNIPLHFFEDRLFKKIHYNFFTKHKRPLSIFLSFLLLFGLLSLVLFLVVPELVDAMIAVVQIGSNSVNHLSSIENSANFSHLPFGEYLQNFNIDWDAIGLWLESLLPTLGMNLVHQLEKGVLSSLKMMIDIFLGFIFSIYILSHKESLISQVYDFFGAWLPSNWNAVLSHITVVFLDSFRNFIVGQTIESIILGTLCAIGMSLLRLPYVSTISVLVGATAFIPYVGAYLAAVIGSIMIFTTNSFQVLIFLVFLFILQQIEGNAIYPKVVGNRIKLPSLWVLFSLIIGGRLFGPSGMILGIPAFSAIYRLLKEATDKRKERSSASK